MRRRPRRNTARTAELFLPHETTGSAKSNPSCFLRAEIDLLRPRSGCRLLSEGSNREGHQYGAHAERFSEFLGAELPSPRLFFGGEERSTGFWDKKFVKMGEKQCTKAAARDKPCVPGRK